MKIWKWRIDIKIKKLANQEKIEFLVRELYKELDSCYDIKCKNIEMKGFDIDNFLNKENKEVIVSQRISAEPFEFIVKL